MKTIREIADELGVSKQAIFKKIKKEPLSTSLQGLTSTVNGRLMVSDDGETLIKQAFSQSEPQPNCQPVDDSDDSQVDSVNSQTDGIVAVLQSTIDTLQDQLEVKDRQIEQQAQTITRLSDALTAAQQTAAAAQALHAGTIQQQLASSEAENDQQSNESASNKKQGWFHRWFGGGN